LVAATFAVSLAGVAADAAWADHTAATLELNPASDTNTVGEQHCVEATYRAHGAVGGVPIRFSISGANSTVTPITIATDRNGKVDFCYIGTKAGTDMITASADPNANGQVDAGEPTAMATKTYVAAAPRTITVSPATSTNPVGTQHCVTATVTDQFGNPNAGIPVRFTVTGANPRSAVVNTNPSGQATFCYTGTNLGTDTITATADANKDGTFAVTEPTGTATKVYVSRVPATVMLSPPADTNTVGEQHCVTATATDSSGNPVTAGERIVFTVSGANSATGTRTTDASGQAVFCYIGTRAGQDTITAFADNNQNGDLDVGEPTGFATKTYVPGAPVTLVVQPPGAENVVGTQHCVMATARDAFGNPVPGVTVRFAVSGANGRTGTSTTDANGNAVFCYRGTAAGLDTISAYADANGNEVQELAEPSGTATKLYHPGTATRVVVSPPGATNTAGEEHCVTASVTDAFGNPTPGVEVGFTVTGANTAAGTDTTDAGGRAEFCYTGTHTGVDTITAVADADGDGEQETGEPAGTATKTYLPGAPSAVTLDPAAATNRAGERHCVTATVTDAFGNTVGEGTAVVFSVEGVNDRDPVTVRTDRFGQAVFCYTGTAAGPDVIHAFADTNGNGAQDAGEPPATATKVYGPGQPATVRVTPATATNRAGEEHCVTATVTDEFGNATPGIAVDFFVTGANAASGDDTTDAQGRAEFCYTGRNAGTDTIRAIADGDEDGEPENGEPTGVATKVYGPAEPATVTVEPPTATNRAGERHCVTATVRDAFGNPVGAGVAVEFTVTGANPGGPTVQQTDAGGRATFCYTGTRTGVDRITAVADGDEDGTAEAGEPQGEATKVYRPGRPATVTVTPAAANNRAGEEHCVTATVRDELGNTVEAGVAVEFDVNGANDRAPVIRRTDENGQAEFCYTGTRTGADEITATADGDEDGTPETGEPTGIATKVYAPAKPETVTVEPATDVNRAGERHCVTATVRDAFGNPVGEGIKVEFQVTGANPTGPTIRQTDEDGQATFCYTGTRAGADAIRAIADGDEDGTVEAGEPTGAASKLYRPGRPATVTVEPPTAVNRAGEEHCVVATVRDEFGNTVEAGVRVEFQVVGANPTGPVIRQTDESGQARFCYRGMRAGEDAIRATADGDEDGTVETGEPTGAATKTYRPGRPATVTVEPVAATNRAGEEHCVTATVRDELGNTVEAGIAVSFDVNGVNDRPPAIRRTDANGQATFCYTGTAVGADEITVTADGDEDGTPEAGEPTIVAAKVYRPGRATAVTVEPPTATNRAGDRHCVTATVRDEFGNTVEADVAVEFTVTGANPRGSTIERTGDDGRATFCYTGTRVGLDTITAVADADEDGDPEAGEPTGTATKVYGPGRPATVVVEPPGAENRAGDEHCVTATVRDEFGNPVEAGVKVEFVVTGGNSAGPTVTTTDEDGRARFCYTGTRIGPDTIRATADGDEDGTVETGEPTGVATKVYRPGNPASVEVQPPTAVNRAGQEHCVTATVRDAFGNRVEAGIAVSFDVSGVNDRQPVVVRTDANGEARFCYTGTRAGVDTITATADGDEDGRPETGEPTGTATKMYRPGAPAAVTVEPPTAVNEAGEEHCVTATVRDEFGNPVDEAVNVFFSVTGANTRADTRVATGDDGQAEFCYTGTRAGEDVIKAVVDVDRDNQPEPTEPTATATKTYVPGPARKLRLEPKVATNPVGTRHCVTATVEDAFGNPVPRVTVRFAVTGSVNTSGANTTDQNGQARFCYDGPQLPGADVIRAYADIDKDSTQDAEEPFDAAEKTWVLPVSTPGCEVKITNGGWIVALNGDRASFGGNAKVDLDGNVSGQEQYTDHGPADPLKVHSLNVLAVVCSADRRQASVYGQARIDGTGSHYYRIQVVDLGEPGTSDRYGILLDTGYYSGDQQLQGGNVQIR
jgi:Bacterial Ig-like domain (group 1)